MKSLTFFKIMFKNSILTRQETRRVCITKISLFMVFRQTVAAYSDNHMKLIETEQAGSAVTLST
jgi:hypothetical protein